MVRTLTALTLAAACAANAAPDGYELADHGRDWLARQVHSGEVAKAGPAAQARTLLAFLSNGHTHRVGEFKRTVNQLVKPLRSLDPTPLSPPDRVIVAWALSELLAVSRDDRARKPAERALMALGEALLDDGLPREAGGAADPLASFDAALACKAARSAGLELPSKLDMRDRLQKLTSDSKLYAAGYPAALVYSGGPRSALRNAAKQIPPFAELDLLGCAWAARSHHMMGKRSALPRDELAARIAELVEVSGPDRGAAKVADDRIGHTARAVLAVDVLFWRVDRVAGATWVTPEALAALPAVKAAADPEALVALLTAAGGQRYESGFREGQDCVAKRPEARLALAQLIAATEGPSASHRFKVQAWTILKFCPTPLEPEAQRLLAELLPKVPSVLAVPISAKLAGELRVKAKVEVGTPLAERVKVAKALLKAVK